MTSVMANKIRRLLQWKQRKAKHLLVKGKWTALWMLNFDILEEESMFMYVYVSMYFDLSGGDRIGHDMNCHQNICVTGNEEEN